MKRAEGVRSNGLKARSSPGQRRCKRRRPVMGKGNMVFQIEFDELIMLLKKT